jgi:cell division protein FtsI/penicillin-binding protein 2
MDLRHALEKSCNVYFYTLGQMLGVDKIYEWADKLGLAGKTGWRKRKRIGRAGSRDCSCWRRCI